MRIAVISPHPDDETLGAGGLLSKYKKRGNQIFWINVTDVEEGGDWNITFVNKRREQIKKIINYYQFDGFYNLKFRPASLENMDKGKIIDSLSKCIKEIEPNWIILPNPTDAHSDHKITYEAGMSCAKVFRYPSIKKIMTMEILSETDFEKYGESFSPNFYIDITESIEQKIEALQIYNTELGKHPFPRNIEVVRALAMLRGCSAGCEYAEAYKIIKEIER